MANVVDSVSISGMKQKDFLQLQEIFEHVMQEDIRWDREDYWDARNKRIAEWLRRVIETTIDNKIKD